MGQAIAKGQDLGHEGLPVAARFFRPHPRAHRQWALRLVHDALASAEADGEEAAIPGQAAHRQAPAQETVTERRVDATRSGKQQGLPLRASFFDNSAVRQDIPAQNREQQNIWTYYFCFFSRLYSSNFCANMM